MLGGMGRGACEEPGTYQLKEVPHLRIPSYERIRTHGPAFGQTNAEISLVDAEFNIHMDGLHPKPNAPMSVTLPIAEVLGRDMMVQGLVMRVVAAYTEKTKGKTTTRP